MRLFILSWMSLSFCFAIPSISSAQDSTRNVVPDTIRQNKIPVTPYYSIDQSNSSFYSRKFADSKLLNLSAGVNIFNVLRGRIPSLSIPSYVQSAGSSALRTTPYLYSDDALLVIDGVAFNTRIDQYANLNSFDFSSISAVSNTGALNFLGGVNSGAFVLSSKTGEGVVNPKFEFNSATNYGWENLNSGQPNSTTKLDEWDLANAIAYSQDFGMIDTRISYTNQKRLFNSTQGPFIHNLKINTGLITNRKFELRLISDGRFSKIDDVYPQSFTQLNVHKKSYDAFVSLNLVAKYKLTNWLFASSQYAGNNYKNNTNLETANSRHIEDIQNLRQQGNFFLTASSKTSMKIHASGSAGVQYLKQSLHRELSNTDSVFQQYEATLDDVNPAVISNLSVVFYDIVFLSSNYRLEKHSTPLSNNKQMKPANDNANSYLISSSFAFGKLIKAQILSFGKFRVATGMHNVFPFNNYPMFNVELTSVPANKQIPYRVRTVESGVDLGLLDSRILVTLNYFSNEEQYDLSTNVANGLDRYKKKGWETDVRYKTKQSENFAFETGLVFSSLVSRVEGKNFVDTYSKPYLRTGWNARLSYKSVMISTVIESLSYQNNDQYTGLGEFSFTKLRDVSVGFPLPVQFAKEATLSVSGRNLAKLGGSGTDWEVSTPTSTFQKSVTINLNLVF